MSLHTIIYSSREKTVFSDVETAGLLDGARAFNNNQDISGILLYFDRVFFQVLEGPRDSIHKLFDKIQADSRHQSVTMHIDEPLEARLFPNWSMAYKAADGNSMRNPEVIADLVDIDQTGSSDDQRKRLSSLISAVANSVVN